MFLRRCFFLAAGLAGLRTAAARDFPPAIVPDSGGRHDRSFHPAARVGAARFPPESGVTVRESGVVPGPFVPARSGRFTVLLLAGRAGRAVPPRALGLPWANET